MTRAGRVAASFAALCIGLLLVEASLRALDLPRFDACETVPDYAVADPELGFRGDPSVPVTGVDANLLGLRGPMPAIPKPNDELRILFLGDSTCWGLGVDLDQSFGARATAMANASISQSDLETARRATFMLGAFPGYSSYHSAILLDRLLVMSPDRVVLYVGARNDADRARYYPDAQIAARRARFDATWHQSHVLRGLEAVSDLLYRNVVRHMRSAEGQARVPPRAFRANLERMAARLREAGVPALVVVPPISAAFEVDQPLVRRYRQILEEVASERGLPVVSIDDAFDERDSQALFFEDGFHLTPAGHALAADAIHQAMLREALLPTRPEL